MEQDPTTITPPEDCASDGGAKVYHDFEKKPFLIILDKDLHQAARMVTDKDVKAYIRNCFNLLVRVYLKTNGIPMGQMVYEQIWEKQRDTILDVFPGLEEKFVPKKPPMTKATEFKFAKLCLENFNYICDFCEALLDEHVTRFRKAHKRERLLTWIDANQPRLASAGTNYTPVYPIRTIPFKYRVGNDYVESARAFYRHLHHDPANDYKLGCPPVWMHDLVDVMQFD